MTEYFKNLEVKEKLERAHEKIFTRIYDDEKEGSIFIARQIADTIRRKNATGETCVLGLATGSSPITVYRELVRMHKKEGLSFKNTVTFNLDEYYPIQKNNVQSYHYFMHEHLFNHIDIPEENVNIPDGTLSEATIYDFCQHYEQKIKSYGGIDIQILGIGRTGHIGFNEPGSGINSPTRLVTLDSLTLADATPDFHTEENVPRRAITMGVGTIMPSQKIFLMAWGEKKAGIVRKMIEGPISEKVPATFLQKHPNVEVILDKAAASELTRLKAPWLVKNVQWDDKTIRKAVLWLCNKLNKPLLKLTNRDYNDNSLGDLITNHGPAYGINLQIFNFLQHSITGWPGGKPNADDTHRPERQLPYPKTVLIFAPHPGDDMLAMGGTIKRLKEQGHILHVVYQTSGNIAVSDDEALRYMGFVKDFSLTYFDTVNENVFKTVEAEINRKQPGDIDGTTLREIKSLVREGEARSACRFIGIPTKNVHFLHMPFYETGTIKKANLSNQDVDLVANIMQQLKPHQVFAAGDLTDPHGTHRKCLNAIHKAISKVRKEAWFADCNIWLYRGVWQEWDLSDVEMAVPLSPDDVHSKRLAIFKHASQKEVVYPGKKNTEIWKYTEERNRETAKHYDKLGMAEYEAAEVFAKW